MADPPRRPNHLRLVIPEPFVHGFEQGWNAALDWLESNYPDLLSTDDGPIAAARGEIGPYLHIFRHGPAAPPPE